MILQAFNYTTQKWVNGEAARPLLIEQFKDSLELLTGPAGPDYFACTKKRDDATTIDQAIESIKSQLAKLWA